MQSEEENKWQKKWSTIQIPATVLQSIIKLQRLWRAQKAKKKTKKMLKYRKNIIEELIKTQQTYLSDISLIICDYKFPLTQAKIIDQSQDHRIFGSIQEIKKLNQQFYVQLYNKFEHFHDYLMIFNQQILKLVPYFKLYFQYIQSYQNALKLVLTLQNTKPQFKRFLDIKQSNPKYRGLGIDSFLIKPIQRLPKYVILLKDLVKHTPDWHPDYNNIIKFLQTIEKVNSHNNQSMNKLLNNLKMAELERNLNVQLIQAGRQFVCEQVVNILVNNKIKDMIMYLFTDLIMLTHKKSKQQQKVHNVILLSRGSFCKDMKDLKYFKNMFSVNGNQGKISTFVCSTQQEKQKLISQITQILENLSQKQVEKTKIMINNKIHNESIIRKISQATFQVEIDVLGTEQRNSFSISKYTIYIIQVKIKNIKHKVFVRFNQLLGIQDYIIKQYPGLLNQNQLLVKTNWLKNHQNKVIEERKLQIQEFLQSILSMNQIRQNGGQILTRLGLPQDFYYLPDKIKTIQQSPPKKSIRHSCNNNHMSKRVSARNYFQELDNSSSQDDSQDQLTFKTNKERYKKAHSPPRSSKNLTAQQLLYANEMILGHFTRLSVNQKRKSSSGTQVQVSIMIPCQKLVYKQLVLKIHKTTRIQHLTIIVANKLGLKYYKDFRFLLKQKSNINRILDDDQIIENVLGMAPNQTNVFKSPTNIYFQKFIYIHPHLEQKEIKQDRVRLTLLSNQALIEIKEYTFRVEYQDYLIFVSLYMILNGYAPKDTYLKEVIKSMLPQQVFLEMETDYWIADIGKCYGIMMEKLKAIYDKIKIMKNEVRLSSILEDPDHHHHTSDFGSIVRLSILSQIQKHFLYGTCLEIVQISEHTRDYLSSLHLEASLPPTRNIWLGIKYDKLMLISANLSDVLTTLKYDELQDIKCQPHCIRISTQKLVFKLKTTRSYFISQLIEYYLKYMELYQRIDKDRKYSDSLITRAREQMKSVIMHDSGSEQEEDGEKFIMIKNSY